MRIWPIKFTLGYLSVLVVLRVTLAAVDVRPRPPPGAPVPLPRPSAVVRTLPPDPVPMAAVACGPTRVRELSPDVYDVVLGEGDDWALGERLVPALRDGKVLGVKLFSARPGSLFSSLGLENGDTLMRLNGLPFYEPERPFEVYRRVRTATHFVLELERAGQVMEKKYEVHPCAAAAPVDASPAPALKASLGRLLPKPPPLPPDVVDQPHADVREISPNVFEVSCVSWPTDEVAVQARIVPYFRDGVALGFQLFSVRPGSIYAQLGIKNGDVLVRINGFDLTSPEKALEIYPRLREATLFEIDLERNGAPLRVTCRLTPPRGESSCRPSTSPLAH